MFFPKWSESLCKKSSKKSLNEITKQRSLCVTFIQEFKKSLTEEIIGDQDGNYQLE